MYSVYVQCVCTCTTTAHLLDGLGGALLRVVLHKAVALADPVGVHGDLGRQDVAKGDKGVVQRLVVDRLVQVFDKDVSRVGLAQGRVAVAPHDAQGAAVDLGKVEGLQGALGCVMVVTCVMHSTLRTGIGIQGGVVVDVGVTQRATRDGITAHADGCDGSSLETGCH